MAVVLSFNKDQDGVYEDVHLVEHGLDLFITLVSKDIYIGQFIFDVLAYDASAILRSENKTCIIEPYDNKVEHWINAKLISLNPPICKVYETNIEVDGYLPGDIIVGEYISFYCARLDI